jgi:hypothetical protein
MIVPPEFWYGVFVGLMLAGVVVCALGVGYIVGEDS